MNQEAFEAACSVAIRDYHDMKQDGPLLVGIRMNTSMSTLEPGTRLVFPEYAATIGEWAKPRAHPYGGLSDSGPEYSAEPAESIAALTQQAKELWHARQPEEVETDPERLKIDALLD